MKHNSLGKIGIVLVNRMDSVDGEAKAILKKRAARRGLYFIEPKKERNESQKQNTQLP